MNGIATGSGSAGGIRMGSQVSVNGRTNGIPRGDDIHGISQQQHVDMS